MLTVPADVADSLHKFIEKSQELDAKLRAALHDGSIKLVSADFLRSCLSREAVGSKKSFGKKGVGKNGRATKDGGSLLLCEAGARIRRRQELEDLEKDSGTRVFLTSEEAVTALEEGGGTRKIGVLSYGWCSPAPHTGCTT